MIPLETFQAIVEHALVGVYVIQDDRMVYVNPKLAQLFGYSPDEMRRFASILELIDESDRERVRESIRRRIAGEIDAIEYTVKGVRKNKTTIIMDIRSVRGVFAGRAAVFGSVLDITKRTQMEEALKSLALMDELTGVYNRRGFMALAERQLKASRRKGQSLVLLASDVDDLKQINDTHGHAVGDQAIMAAATVLKQTYREADVIARLGGDEFTVFPLDAAADSTPLLISRLQERLRDWNVRTEAPFELSMSVGWAVVDPGDRSKTLEQALSEADAQLYEQKRSRASGPARDAGPPFWGRLLDR
jgi:diguanylate cyclase (GGDEF)-like protein/PAS domain S-box-containing protein